MDSQSKAKAPFPSQQSPNKSTQGRENWERSTWICSLTQPMLTGFRDELGTMQDAREAGRDDECGDDDDGC